MLYEVWLPHISEGTVTVQHSACLDPHASFFAAQRSTQAAGCFGTSWAALHYLCSQWGMSHPLLKQLSFWTRCRFLSLALTELAHPSCSVDARELRLLQWACGRTAHSARKLLQAGQLSDAQMAQCVQPVLDGVLGSALSAAERCVHEVSNSSMQQLLRASKPGIGSPHARYPSRLPAKTLVPLHTDALNLFQQRQYRWQPPVPCTDVQRRIAVPDDDLTLGWLPLDDRQRPADVDELASWECKLVEAALCFCEATRSVHIRPGKRCSDAAAAALGRLCWALEVLFLRILPLPTAGLSAAHQRMALRSQGGATEAPRVQGPGSSQRGATGAPSMCTILFELSRHYLVGSLSLPSVAGHSATHAHASRVLTLSHMIVKHAALAGCGGGAAAAPAESLLPAPWLGVMSRGAGDVVLPRMLENLPMTQDQSASYQRLMAHLSQCGYTMVSVEPPRLVECAATSAADVQPPTALGQESRAQGSGDETSDLVQESSIFTGYLRSLEESHQVLPTAVGNNSAAWAKPTSLFNFGREGIYQRLDVESDASLLMAQRYVEMPHPFEEPSSPLPMTKKYN